MTDGLDQALVNAGLNLLRADVSLTVCDGKVPNGTVPPWVLVYTSLSRPSGDPDNSMAGTSNVWVLRMWCHCVGGGDNGVAARAVAQRVRTQLLDVQLVVAGLSCGRFRLDESVPPTKDEITGVLVMDAVDVYSLRATS